MKLKQSLLQYISKDSPRQMRYNCARGIFKMPPQDLMPVLYVLGFDKDEQIAEEAKRTIMNMSADDVHHALGAPMDKDMLDKATVLYRRDAEALRQVLMNKETGIETLKRLAATGPIEIVKAIMEGPPRIKDNNEIRHAFLKNPLAAPFAKKMQPTGESEEEIEAKHKARLQEVMAEEQAAKAKTEAEAEAKTAAEAAANTKAPTTDDAGKEGEKKEKEVNPADDDSLPLTQRLKHMSIGQKIKVAQTCDKEGRTILIKEANKQISTAVMKNPRMTESEIMKLAVTKGTIEELLRMIAGNKEWMKTYAVKVALVTNPKTPVPLSIRMLNTIYIKDLEKIAKSRGIPSVVSSNAKKILDAKKKKGG